MEGEDDPLLTILQGKLEAGAISLEEFEKIRAVTQNAAGLSGHRSQPNSLPRSRLSHHTPKTSGLSPPPSPRLGRRGRSLHADTPAAL